MLINGDTWMKKLTKNIFTKKVPITKKSEYLLTISKLLQNGFSLSETINCLRLLNDQEKIFELIYQDLCHGKMISQALQHLHLPMVIYNQLVIAQNHGKLAQAMAQTGTLLNNQAKQKNKLKEVLVYPCFILMFLITMLVGMKLYIIPQLAMANGNLIDLFLEIILGVIALIILFSLIFHLCLQYQDEYHRALVLVKLPILGKIYLNFFQFLILQGLGMQLANGMNFFDICELNHHFEKGSIQSHLADEFLKGLTNGNNLLKLIQTEPLLPNQLQVILQAGESGSALAQDLLVMSELKFEETQRDLRRVMGMIQPFLFAIIAVIIVTTYLIILLPIYGMMKGIS